MRETQTRVTWRGSPMAWKASKGSGTDPAADEGQQQRGSWRERRVFTGNQSSTSAAHPTWIWKGGCVSDVTVQTSVRAHRQG